MKLVAGLGNPGAQYDRTRHNAGFMVLDALAPRLKFSFSPSAYKGELAQIRHARHDKVFFLKPATYMNLSGQSVAPLARFYKIPAEDILVVHDDLDLPLGRLRLASGGSPAGHNGLKSLIESLGTKDFHRLKIGIGRPTHPGQEVVSYVLDKFLSGEAALLGKVLALAAEAAEAWLEEGLERAMNRYNGAFAS